MNTSATNTSPNTSATTATCLTLLGLLSAGTLARAVEANGVAEGRSSRDVEAVTARGEPQAEIHWALRPIRAQEVPSGQHPMDFFVDQGLKQRGFVAAPRADARTLVRRAAYDLLGLPPAADHGADSAGQFANLVDTLLDSPHYGERWGRHWLDVARYADTKDGVLMYGDGRIRPFAYTYRDYVIRAFNEDKPFDRFIHEQLAADQLGLPPDAPELAAMGFLTLGRMFDNNPYDIIDDQIDTVTRGLLGLTVSCARCHDHKFDPIPTADYYSLYGVFASSEAPLERPRIETPTTAGEAFEKELAAKLAEAYKMRAEQHQFLLATARQRTADYLVRVATTPPDISETTQFFLSLRPEDLRPQFVHRWRKLIERRAHHGDPVFAPWHDLMLEPTLRTESWRRRGVDERVIQALITAAPKTPAAVARIYGELLVRVFEEPPQTNADDPLRALLSGRESPVWFPESQAWYYMSRKEKDKYRGLTNGLDALAVKSPHAAARAMSLVDAERSDQPVVFRRGNPSQPGAAVPRQFLKIVSGASRRPFSGGSGRLDLAKAITAAENPLTARVLVNRVWMHHFGQPLVENPSDFGLRTPPPTHPKLLDFLAGRLLENGWRLKPLHRLIMSSAAYQRSSQVASDKQLAQQQRLDPDNRWLWRASRRRLDLEAMRDTILAVSGQLDLTMFGRPVPIDSADNHRRTVYALVERQSVPSIVQNFDFASPDTSVGQRNVTTVPQQALFAMNSEFMQSAATALDQRVGAVSAEQRIQQLHRMIYARSASAGELRLGMEFVEQGSWQQYAQVLLMTNELMFID